MPRPLRRAPRRRFRPRPRSGPPLRSRLPPGPAPRTATLANSTGCSSGARGRRPEKPELGEPSGPRPPSSHGGGRAAAPGAALGAAGALRAAGGPAGQPSRPRPGTDPAGKLRRATIGERGQALAHPKAVPEGPPHPLPLPGAAAPGADSAPDVRPARRPRTCPARRAAGVCPSRWSGVAATGALPGVGARRSHAGDYRGAGAGVPRVSLPGRPSLAARIASRTPTGTTSRPAGATNAASCTEPCSLPVE